MQKKLIPGLLILLISSCSTTTIGGNASTAKTSGDFVGPASMAQGDISVAQDTIDALTVGGNLSANKFKIINDLQVAKNAQLTKVKVLQNTQIGGNLTTTSSTFYATTKVQGNLISTNSSFKQGLEFAGNQLQLTKHSKVSGNVISTSPQATTISIDDSTVTGDIGFANSSGVVILINDGRLKGKLINGTLQKK